MIILSRFLTVFALASLIGVSLPATARSAGSDARFSWPLSPDPAVVTPFEQPSNEYGPGHRGVDLAAFPGQQVLAAGPGVVVFAGAVAGQGVVSIDHDGELH